MDKQAHENVLRQINQKQLPDFTDSADTITLQDLDKDFTAAGQYDRGTFKVRL